MVNASDCAIQNALACEKNLSAEMEAKLHLRPDIVMLELMKNLRADMCVPGRLFFN